MSYESLTEIEAQIIKNREAAHKAYDSVNSDDNLSHKGKVELLQQHQERYEANHRNQIQRWKEKVNEDHNRWKRTAFSIGENASVGDRLAFDQAVLRFQTEKNTAAILNMDPDTATLKALAKASHLRGDGRMLTEIAEKYNGIGDDIRKLLDFEETYIAPKSAKRTMKNMELRAPSIPKAG